MMLNKWINNQSLFNYFVRLLIFQKTCYMALFTDAANYN